MPVLMSPEIANKFKEKWMTIHPDEQDNISGSVHFDDSLTSLHWLQNFSILSDTQGKFPSSGCHPQHLFYSRSQLGGHDSPSSPPAGDTAASGMPQTPGNPTTSCSGMLNQYGQHITVPANPPEDIDYKTNRYVKPPYSYATLICMAMRASNKTKVTLSAIYSWITENFCYYRYAEPSWQNSIRHNLSLNKCFMKVPRQKDEPGKGGFWQIDPQYADMFVNGVFKRRRMPAANFNTHRQSKQLSSRSSHAITTDQPITGLFQECLPGSKRKQIHPKRSGKLAKISKSPLLTEFHASDILRGDFDLSSVIDDVLSGNDSTFEDLDINNALSSLGCGSEPSQSQHALGYSEDVKACAYIEANSMMECKMEDFTQQHLYQDQAHLQYYEGMILFPDQAQQHHLHSWEIKEEVQAIPITMDDGYGVCEGFYSEMQHYTHY